MASVVVLVSGGMDSAALLYDCLEKFGGPREVVALSVNYGQRHRCELEAGWRLCNNLGVQRELVDLSGLRALFSGSALTDNVDVPEGHYAADTMKATVVPMRNPTFMCVAAGLAWARGAKTIATAVHAGDHAIYPDCRPEFIAAFGEMAKVAAEGFSAVDVYTPFLFSSKADIVRRGHALNVPWAETWSCYKGEAVHCGRCGTCVERREAFELAGVTDPTVYAC